MKWANPPIVPLVSSIFPRTSPPLRLRMILSLRHPLLAKGTFLWRPSMLGGKSDASTERVPSFPPSPIHHVLSLPEKHRVRKYAALLIYMADDRGIGNAVTLASSKGPCSVHNSELNCGSSVIKPTLFNVCCYYYDAHPSLLRVFVS